MRTEDREDAGGSMGCAWMSALRPIAQSMPVKQGSTTVRRTGKDMSGTASWHRLNGCVPPKSPMWNLSPRNGVWRWGLWEVRRAWGSTH